MDAGLNPGHIKSDYLPRLFGPSQWSKIKLTMQVHMHPSLVWRHRFELLELQITSLYSY